MRNASTGTNISANQSFVYDALDRLTSATGPYGTQTFTYSAIGNITNNSALGAYTYGAKPHAVTQTGATTYTYDNNGNMSGGNGRTFTYDLDNRPTSITLSGVTTTMVYDASGSRVKKTVGSTTSVYIGDKYSCTVGGSCSRYVFGGNQRLAAVSGSTTYYYHGDHLGSTHVVTSSTQSPAQTVTYRPFGFTDVNAGSIDVRYKYTGQEIDDSTGLYYYKARYYAPLVARFIQPDSIVSNPINPQAYNRYSYVLNNPIKYVDPTGHVPNTTTNFQGGCTSSFTGYCFDGKSGNSQTNTKTSIGKTNGVSSGNTPVAGSIVSVSLGQQTMHIDTSPSAGDRSVSFSYTRAENAGGPNITNPAQSIARNALYDQHLNIFEANEIWRANTDPSFELNVDASQLIILQTTDFDANGTARGIVLGMDWLVSGTITLSRDAQNNVVILPGMYDFQPHGTLFSSPVRNIETYIGFWFASQAGTTTGTDYLINYNGYPDVIP